MRVAVAVISDEKQRILITRRPLHTAHGGFWEFPGGKLEDDELASAALVREIKEEVGLDVLEYRYLGEVHYTYEQRTVSLLVYHVSSFQGEAICCEDQMDLRWVERARLHQFQFPAANLEIIKLVDEALTRATIYPT